MLLIRILNAWLVLALLGSVALVKSMEPHPHLRFFSPFAGSQENDLNEDNGEFGSNDSDDDDDEDTETLLSDTKENDRKVETTKDLEDANPPTISRTLSNSTEFPLSTQDPNATTEEPSTFTTTELPVPTQDPNATEEPSTFSSTTELPVSTQDPNATEEPSTFSSTEPPFSQEPNATEEPSTFSSTEPPTELPTLDSCEVPAYPESNCVVSVDGGQEFRNAQVFSCNHPFVTYYPQENALECQGTSCQGIIVKGCKTILCQGPRTCTYSDFWIPDHGNVLCDGQRACLGTTMTHSGLFGNGVSVVCRGGKEACGSGFYSKATWNLGEGEVTCWDNPCGEGVVTDGNSSATCVGLSVAAKCLKVVSQVSSLNVDYTYLVGTGGLGMPVHDNKFGLYGVCPDHIVSPQVCLKDGTCSEMTQYSDTDPSCFADSTIEPTTLAPTTTEPPSAPNTTTPNSTIIYVGPFNAQCYRSYRILNTTDRNLAYTDRSRIYCDGLTATNRSPQWRGSGWYRFVGEAGEMISEYLPPHDRCASHYSTWLKGRHPAVDDGIEYRQLCVRAGSYSCYWSWTIAVLNCGEFFLYHLKEVPHCSLRYCAVNIPE